MARHAQVFAQGGIPQLLGANLVSLTGNHAEGQLRPADIHGMLLDNVTVANDMFMRPHMSASNVTQHQSISTQPYSASQPINMRDHAAQQGYVQAITTRSDGKVVKLMLEPVNLPSAGGATQTSQIFSQQVENVSMRPPSHWPSGLPTITPRQLQPHSMQQDNLIQPGQNNLPAFVRMPDGTQLLLDSHRDNTNQYQANAKFLQTPNEAGLTPPRSMPINFLHVDAATMNGLNLAANTPEASRVEAFQFATTTPVAMHLPQQQVQQRRRQSSELGREPAGKRIKYADGLPIDPSGHVMNRPFPQTVRMQNNNSFEHIAVNNFHNPQTNTHPGLVIPAMGCLNDQQTVANWSSVRDVTPVPFQNAPANDINAPPPSSTVVLKLVAQLVASPSGSLSLLPANGVPLPNLANQVVSTPQGPMQLVPSRLASSPGNVRAPASMGQYHSRVSEQNNMRVGHQAALPDVNVGMASMATSTGLVPSPYNNTRVFSALDVSDKQGLPLNVAGGDSAKAPVSSSPHPSSMMQQSQTNQPAVQTPSRLLVATLSDGRKVIVQPIGSLDTAHVNSGINPTSNISAEAVPAGNSPARSSALSDFHSRQQNMPTIGLTVPIEETPSGRVLVVNQMQGLADPVLQPKKDASLDGTNRSVCEQHGVANQLAMANITPPNVVRMLSQSGEAVAAPTIQLVETAPASSSHSKGSGSKGSQQQQEPSIHLTSTLPSVNGNAQSVYGPQAVLTSPFELPQNDKNSQDKNIEQSTSTHANQGSDAGSSWQGSQAALQHAVQFAAGSQPSLKMTGVLDLAQPRMSDTGSGAHTRSTSMLTVSKPATKETAGTAIMDVSSQESKGKREMTGPEQQALVTWAAPILWAPEHHADPSKPMFVVTSTVSPALRRQLPEKLVVNDFKPAKEISIQAAKETLQMQLQPGSTPAQQASVQQLVQAELCLVCTALPHTQFVVLPKEVGGKYAFIGLLMPDMERRASGDRTSSHSAPVTTATTATPQPAVRDSQQTSSNALHGHTSSSSMIQPHASGNHQKVTPNGVTAPVLDLSVGASKHVPGNLIPALQSRLSGYGVNTSLQSRAST